MTTLRSASSLSGNAAQPAPGDLLTAAVGLARDAGRRWRQAVETHRARRHLMELDEHLLRDVGLDRAEVRFGDFEALGRQRRAGGVR